MIARFLQFDALVVLIAAIAAAATGMPYAWLCPRKGGK
jgi:hypothetical protein